MTDIHIPPEALEAGARHLCRERHPCWSIVDEVMARDYDGQATEFREAARACCLAMLKAWPGMMMALTTERGVRCLVDPSDATHIILPLTEKTEARAALEDKS